MHSNDNGKDIKKILETEVLTGISPNIKEIIRCIPQQYISMLEEIRIRLNKPLMIHSNKFDHMITSSGAITNSAYDAYIVSREDCERTIQLLSNYSIYAIEEELKNGYITLKGGHRVGIVGRGIIEGGKVKALKNISGFNIRISRQIIGAADNLIKYIIKSDSDIYNTLIISCSNSYLLFHFFFQVTFIYF